MNLNFLTKFSRFFGSDPGENLAFIGCAPRSGSTLLTRILDSHSRIASPCELAIPSYFAGDTEKELRVNNKYRLICAYYAADWQACLTDPCVLFQKILTRENKLFLVLKDPRQSLFFESIERDFPKAKFIHLVRDARSIALSVMFKKNPVYGMQRWYEYNFTVLNLFKRLPEKRKLLFHYEDLLTNPDVAMKNLVEFIGFQFEPAMLDYGQFSHADNEMKLWNGQSPSESPLHKNLQNGRIDPNVMKEKKTFPTELISLYDSLPHVVRMNKIFGYD